MSIDWYCIVICECINIWIISYELRWAFKVALQDCVGGEVETWLFGGIGSYWGGGDWEDRALTESDGGEEKQHFIWVECVDEVEVGVERDNRWGGGDCS